MKEDRPGYLRHYRPGVRRLVLYVTDDLLAEIAEVQKRAGLKRLSPAAVMLLKIGLKHADL